MGENDVHLPGGSFSGLLLSAEYPPLFSANTPKILSFGDFAPQINPNSSNSTPTPNAFNTLKRKNGSGLEPRKRSRRKKKDQMGPTPAIRTTSVVHAKVRREKLGERIAALQQLVSPFGKTDTASVLHEAMGYIRFLEDQVKVLSSPYLQCSNHLSETEGEKWTGSITKGLMSTGLCLVPLHCFVDGVDFCPSAPTTTPSKP